MADFRPVLAKDFDPSKVNFTNARVMVSGAKLFFLEYNGGPLVLQSPEMPLTFDPQVFEDGPNSKYNVKSTMDLSNEPCKVFHGKMVEFDDHIKNLAKENSVEWFKKKNLSNDVVESMFTPTVKVYLDPETGEPTGRFPPTFGFKVKKRDGKILCRCFNGKKEEINFNDKEADNFMEFNKCMKKNSQVKGLFKCDFIWHSPGKFGCSWSAQQLRIKTPKGFDEYAFMDDSDDENEANQLAEANFVDSDSDEEGEVGAVN